MINIFLVRHAEKEPRRGDPPITITGQLQAKRTGSALTGQKISRILSSPTQRTTQTAKIISQSLLCPITIDDRLKERFDFGEVKDQSYREYLKLCKISTIQRDYTLPNGESSQSTGLRIRSVIDEITQNSVLITHGGAIADFIRSTFLETEIQNKWPKFYEEYMVQNCSITQIRMEKNQKSKLIRLGDITHLRET